MMKHHLLIVLSLGALALVACTACTSSEPERANSGGETMTTDTNGANAPATTADGQYVRPSDDVLKQRLNDMQWRVTQQDATEPPFRNEYWDNHEHGIYVDITTGEPLFSSLDKFDSGSGWPSFCKPIDNSSVIEKQDASHGMVRTEVRSQDGDAHLGHLFPDGPEDRGGMRYCINSAALRFVPVSELEAQGYGMYVQMFVDAGVHDAAAVKTETATLAGGCFWGMEEIIRKIPGVIDTVVGYTGGDVVNATYRNHDGHAEAVKITFDPSKLTFEQLLENWFFRMHDPTTKNRQGNDIGTSYRSAIFYHSPEQKKAAEEVKARVDASGKWGAPIVTEIVPADAWWDAEQYHQDYLQKNPGGYTCHWLRD